ncbi:MAG: hypothetical protein WAU77_11355 [Solirubrobacteraceae bacterium]|jgi:hypothetical protein
MSSWTKSVCGVVTVLVALVGGGCGSSSSQSGEGQAVFRARANAVCTKAKQQAEQLTGTYPQVFNEQSSPTPAEAAKPLAELLSLGEGERRQMSMITPPPEDQGTYTEMLASFDMGIKELATLVQAADAGNQEHMKAVEDEVNSASSARDQKLKTTFTSLGLVACAEAAIQR